MPSLKDAAPTEWAAFEQAVADHVAARQQHGEHSKEAQAAHRARIEARTAALVAAAGPRAEAWRL